MESGSPPVSIERLLEHADWVRWLARVLVADDAAAEDVEQETWLEAIERPPATDAHPRHWLALVARNAARKLIRKRRSTAALEQLTAQSEALPATDAVVARAALQQRVVAAVMQLAEPYRSTLLQRFFDQLPPRAIAAAANVSVETVKTRLKRGLALVREHLQGDFEREGRSWQLALLPLCRGPVAVPVVGSTVAAALGAFIVANAAKIGLMVAAVAVVSPFAWWVLALPSKSGATSETTRVADPSAASAPARVEAAGPIRAAEPATETTRTAAEPAAVVTPDMTGTLHGRVVDLGGQPVAGAAVYIGDQREYTFRDHDTFVSSISGGRVGEPPARSAADGTFELGGIDRRKIWSVGAGHPDAGCGFATPIQFGPDELTRSLEIQLEGGISFVGVCTDPEGQPLPYAIVAIAMKRDEPNVRPQIYGDVFIDALVGADGTFATMPVPLRYFAVRSSALGGFDELRIPWTRIPEGQREWRLDLRLQRPVALTGRVLAMDGSPAHLATALLPGLTVAEKARQSRETLAVLAFSDDPRRDPKTLSQVDVYHPRSVTIGMSYAYGTLDLEHDRYTIERPPLAVRFVAVMVRDELLGVAEFAKGGPAPDVTIDIAMLPESPLVRAVRFTATSMISHRPLDGVDLNLSCYSPSDFGIDRMQAFSEREAEESSTAYVREFVLPIGAVVITATRSGYMKDHLQAEVPPGDEPLELTLALQPAGEASICGDVVDADGHPVAGAPLRLYRKSDMKALWTKGEHRLETTDPSGHFELRDLPAVDYVVVADRSRDDRESDLAPTAIVVRAGEAPELSRLVLPHGVKCTLDISFIDGVQRNFRMRVFTADGLPLIDEFNPYFREYWRPLGRNTIHLPAGITTLEFTGPTGRVKTLTLDPATAATATILLPAD